MVEWATAGPAVGAAFLASLVEVVTIVLVVATLRGWKPTVLIQSAKREAERRQKA